MNYLGGEMPTFALNFSRPGAQVAAQYYNFLRLGFDGYRAVHQTCQDIAMHLSSQIAKLGPFELLTDGSDLPVFAFKLRDDVTGLLGLRRLRAAADARLAGARLHVPRGLTDTAVMRIVVRNGFSMDLANLLLDDLRVHVTDPGAPPADPAAPGVPGEAPVVQALARSSTSSFKH